MTLPRRIVVVGGVAAGASAAAKARRTSEDVDIVVIEAGPYISFANCGLPYYVGGEIPRRQRLFVTTVERFTKRYNLEVRVNTRATVLDRRRRTVTTCTDDRTTGETPYDRLILATGATGARPPIPGLDHPNLFTLRTVPDADVLTDCLATLLQAERGAEGAPPRALVIGGGYVGLETAEQLLGRGLKVTVVEMADQLMLTLDAEMAEPLRTALTTAGAEVILSEAVTEIVERGGTTAAVTGSGRELLFDVAILAVGVKPNVALAASAGVVIGPTGAISVDEFQRTSDPAVYAAGDNAETRHLVTGRPVNIPLAGPATKAGRVAGANAAMDLAGVPDDAPTRLRSPGVLGTAVVRVCGTVAAVTGLTESQARRENVNAHATYLPGQSHAGYYPGAEPLLVKLLYDPDDGRILGAQAVGRDGVDKRIDVLATAIAARMTVEDLEHLDLCYAPPFGAARDVVIGTGFAAANTHRRQMPALTPRELLDELQSPDPPLLLDVRTLKEYEAGHLKDALHIHVDDLREHLRELPDDRPVVIYCASGYRSYLAQRTLMNHGWSNVRNLLGGYLVLRQTLSSRRGRED